MSRLVSNQLHCGKLSHVSMSVCLLSTLFSNCNANSVINLDRKLKVDSWLAACLFDIWWKVSMLQHNVYDYTLMECYAEILD